MTQYKAVAPHALRSLAASLLVALTMTSAANAQDAAPAAEAAVPVLREDVPMRYVVKPGDTLWGIASRYLADAWQWPELWYVNGKLANPHAIYPGDVLELHNVAGRMVLSRQGSETPPSGTGADMERRSPQLRESQLGDALQAIPLDAIRNFLNGPRAVDLETLNAAPYLLAIADDRLLGAAQMTVYIKRLAEGQGTIFATMRQGVAYKDPDTGKLLGYEAIPSGEVEIKSYGPPAVGVMSKSTREVLAGDRLLPLLGDNFQANFYPHAPAQLIEGRIISLYDGVSQTGQFQIVALNRGSKHSLEVGHVLTVLQAGQKVKDPVTGRQELLPKQDAGLLMVFKVMPTISYGLVMSASRAIHVLDHVQTPDRAQQ